MKLTPHKGRLRRFGRDARGAAAIEFAFVAGPFLFMLFAVIELALVFLVSTSLDAASDRAARRIRTGQFQTANETKVQFKTAVCSKMTWLADDCTNRLTVNVQTYTLHSQVQPYAPVEIVNGRKVLKAEANFPASMPAETIVVVRSYYKWPLISPFLNQALERLEGGVALVSSTQIFRTEPYQ